MRIAQGDDADDDEAAPEATRAEAVAGGVGVSARIAVERARTAYHEAGHLVIGMLFGFRCSSVSIRPDETRGSLGRVVPLDEHGGRVAVEIRRGTVERWLCVLFAGYAAEVRFAPDARDAAREGARGDDGQAEEYLERAGMANDSTRHLMRARTAELVEQHWATIESVARALLKHEEFDAREVERICERPAPRERVEPGIVVSGHRRREVGA